MVSEVLPTQEDLKDTARISMPKDWKSIKDTLKTVQE